MARTQLLCLCLCLLIISACRPAQPSASILKFSVTPPTGSAPLGVEFTWSLEVPSGVVPLCKLDFDGSGTFDATVNNCASVQSASFTYAKVGEYQARLRVEASGRTAAEKTVQLNVVENQNPAIASFSAEPASGILPLTAEYRWNLSDPNGDRLRCQLDIDSDGVIEHNLQPCPASHTISHTYSLEGNVVAKLKVEDGKGGQAERTASLTVLPVVPSISKFEASPATGVAPLEVGFSWDISSSNSNLCRLDPQDDGSFDYTVNGCTPGSTLSHTYSSTGTYKARLRLENASGSVDKVITVVVAPSPPTIAQFSASPVQGQAPLEVIFSWALSSATPASCKLDPQGDGSFDLSINDCTSSSTLKHTYTDAGNFSAKLRVENAGGAAEQTTAVQVAAPPPPNQNPLIAVFSANPGSGSAPLTVTFNLTVSDPDGDALSCKLDFENDGTDDSTLQNCTNHTLTHTYTGAGSFTARLLVQDPQGGSAQQTRVIGVGSNQSSFNIALRYFGTVSQTQKSAFESASTRWSQIITQDLPNVNASIPAGSCGSVASSFSGTIDDVLIDAAIVDIDGPGGVLGQAGPCFTRSSNSLTLYGVMEFDSADVANLEAAGQLTSVILHEMGHVLGLGTLWNVGGRTLLSGAGTNNPRFVGANAVREWQAIGGSGNLPVENTGGPGTRDGHWRESVLKNELMTGFLNNGANPLSKITVGSFADLGYVVNYAAADAYSLSLQAPQEAGLPLNIRLIFPIGSVP